MVWSLKEKRSGKCSAEWPGCYARKIFAAINFHNWRSRDSQGFQTRRCWEIERRGVAGRGWLPRAWAWALFCWAAAFSERVWPAAPLPSPINRRGRTIPRGQGWGAWATASLFPAPSLITELPHPPQLSPPNTPSHHQPIMTRNLVDTELQVASACGSAVDP